MFCYHLERERLRARMLKNQWRERDGDGDGWGKSVQLSVNGGCFERRESVRGS